MNDWDTIWRSEAAALAADREVQELWAAGMAQWTAQSAARWADLIRSVPGSGAGSGPGSSDDGAGGRARPDAAPGTAPAAPAPDAVADLERRVAELERRLSGRPDGRRG